MKHGPVNKIELVSDADFRVIVGKGHTWSELSTLLGYKGVMSSNCKTVFLERCDKLKTFPVFSKRSDAIDLQRKGEYFKNKKNWWQAAIGIRKRARKIFLDSGKPKCCAVCGYSRCVEIAHIHPVSSFSDDTLIKDINVITNLIALCPTHHWEFDNGYLKI